MTKFCGVCLITDDVPALTRFYETVLQTTAEGDDIHADVHTDSTGLAIYSKAAAERDMGFGFDVYSGTGKMTLGFNVEDVDAEYERLKALGIKFVVIPTTYPWGSRAMHFRDPDGNIITFRCPASSS